MGQNFRQKKLRIWGVPPHILTGNFSSLMKTDLSAQSWNTGSKAQSCCQGLTAVTCCDGTLRVTPAHSPLYVVILFLVTCWRGTCVPCTLSTKYIVTLCCTVSQFLVTCCHMCHVHSLNQQYNIFEMFCSTMMCGRHGMEDQWLKACSMEAVVSDRAVSYLHFRIVFAFVFVFALYLYCMLKSNTVRSGQWQDGLMQTRLHIFRHHQLQSAEIWNIWWDKLAIFSNRKGTLCCSSSPSTIMNSWNFSQLHWQLGSCYEWPWQHLNVTPPGYPC